MDVREKLVELMDEAEEWADHKCDELDCETCPADKMKGNCVQQLMVDRLIAHGVTVQDGKPLEAFLHPIDAYKGLKAKYLVFKADTGKVVDNCFVLRPDKDVAAVEALRAYANATDNKTLAEDIYSWVGKGEPVQEWISVKDRLPDMDEKCLLCMENRITKYRWVTIGYFHTNYDEYVTHWQPMPQPPKGE